MFPYKGKRDLDSMFQFVTEGYKSSINEEIPDLPNVFQEKVKQLRVKFQILMNDHENLKFLLEDFNHILEFRKNAAAVLIGFGVIVGVILANILSLLNGLGRGNKNAKKKKNE